MARLEVRDDYNGDRLLGSVEVPDHMAEEGRHLKMAAMPNLSSFALADPIFMSLKVETAMFIPRWKQTDRFTKKLMLATSDPLERLMKIASFRLPYEDERQASHRRHVATF